MFVHEAFIRPHNSFGEILQGLFLNRLPLEKEEWEASSDAERQSVAFRKYNEQQNKWKKTTRLSV